MKSSEHKEHSLQRCLHLDIHERVAWKGLGIRRPLLRKRRARKKWLAKLAARRYDAKTVTFGFLYGGPVTADMFATQSIGRSQRSMLGKGAEWGYAEWERQLAREGRDEDIGSPSAVYTD